MNGLDVRRAGRGSFMIALAIYAAVVGRDILASAVIFAAHAPNEAPLLLWAGLGLCAFFFLAGALQLYVGATKYLGERDLIAGAKALMSASCAAGLLWYGAYLPGWPVLNLCLKGIYIAWIPASLARALLHLRGLPETQLPDPEDVEDMPMSGPADRKQAREGMEGRGDWEPPHFRS